MRGVLMVCFEDVGALSWLKEREGEGRIRWGVLERDMVVEMALWAMVNCLFERF